jgi:adenylate cyclase
MSDARRLAAILAIDVVGYSRLMGADESGTAKAMRERREAMRPIVRDFGGRLVKTTGDGVLLEFPSIVAAVACAIATQKRMAERNAAAPEPKRMLYRMGVNLGDVIIDGEDILGDGVNVAARLEGICEPGGLALSDFAYESVRGRIEAGFIDLGERSLKNIEKPLRVWGLSPEAIAAAPSPDPLTPELSTSPATRRRWPALLAAVVVVALAAAGIAWRSGGLARLAGPPAVEDRLAAAPRLSIVVLPFDNLSGDPEQSYFADGITDDLTTDLSHLPDSFVIARNTAFTFKGKPIDVGQLGRELGVRYVLEGSVRRLNEKISVNAQLISTETGAHVWADRFDGERSRLGDLQVEFVARLANSLGVELVKAESLRALRLRPNNPDAVDLYMQGRTAFGRGFAVDNVTEAGEDFARALQLDPNLAGAQVGLARTLFDRVIRFRVLDTANLDRAESLVATALLTNPNDAEAHFVKGEILTYGRHQLEAAVAELKVAIENDRNFAPAYAQYGASHWFIGKAAEVIPNVETALRLSPRDPLRNFWELFICHAHAHLAEWEQAVEWCEKSIATRAYWQAYVDLAAAESWLGRDTEAKAAIAEVLKLRPDFTLLIWKKNKVSDDPTFKKEFERITEGLRKAGLPEGEKAN